MQSGNSVVRAVAGTLNHKPRDRMKRVSFDENFVAVKTGDADDPWGEGIHSNQLPCPIRNEERILRAYAVARYRALLLANGDGRVDDEDSPGGWSRSENSQK